MSVKINNVTFELTTKRAGKTVTEVSSVEALAEHYTTAQLNHIAERYLGRTFNKVARKKMAEKIFPVLCEKAGASADTAKKGPGERKARLYIVNEVEIPEEEKIPPQCRKIGEIFSAIATDKGVVSVEKTKDELLKALSDGGFETRGNPWNNVMFYRQKLIELGVMER